MAFILWQYKKTKKVLHIREPALSVHSKRRPLSKRLIFIRLSAGLHCHADDDGRERGRLCPRVRVRIRGHEPLPVPSRFFLCFYSF